MDHTISLNEHHSEQKFRNTARNMAYSDVSLESLMAAYQDADDKATKLLIELLSPDLFRFFAGQMGSLTEAEDMLQDTWLRIHRARYTYRSGEPMLPWVYAIARRVRVDSFRKRKRITSREIAMAVLPEKGIQRSNASVAFALEDLTISLPEAQRRVIKFLKVDGYTIAEIADMTSSTTGAVKQRAARGYGKLRRILSTNGFTTGA